MTTLTRVFVLVLLIAFSGIAHAQGDPRSNVSLNGMTPNPEDFPDIRNRQQNEPACAFRPDDSGCLICAYNDYRAVDLDIGFGDSWQGVSQSCDLGDTWRSRLAPGHPGDKDADVIPAQFAADPRVIALPGMAILNFIAGYRDSNEGVLAIQHWLEVNKEDADHYEPGRQTWFADTGTSGRFLDKPDMLAVLDPATRQGTISLDTVMENTSLGNNGVITRSFPTGKLYVAYAVFTGSNSVKVLVKVSDDWGRTFKNQAMKLSEDQNQVSGITLTAIGDDVLAVWRRKGDGNDVDSIMYSIITGGNKATKGEVLADICAFDQPTLTGTETTPGVVTFRTNDFPWTATDGNNFFVFFSERPRDAAGACITDAPPRIVMHYSSDAGASWEDPILVDDAAPAESFQFMPTALGADGRVQLAWYDTRRNLDGDPLNLPFVADYELGGFLTHRKVDVYTTSITMSPNGPVIPAPVRASQFSIVVEDGADEGYESEASFANKKLFAQGKASFLGDYIAMAARTFRRVDSGPGEGKWEDNSTMHDGKEDFFVAWTDNRDVRGEIGFLTETLNFSYTPQAIAQLDEETETSLEAEPEMLAEETGPPRDRTQTAESVDGDDPNAIAACIVETERTRDANIYGSLIKDQLRLYAPTNSKPLSGLQRAFVVAMSNSADTDQTYDLHIEPGNCNAAACSASFRQQPSVPPFAPDLDETVTVPAKSSLARTVFVSGDQGPIRVNATDANGDLVASIQLGNAPGMIDPENCADPSCAVAFNELHNIELQSVTASLLNANLLNASLLNSPLLVDWAVENGCCEGEEQPTAGSVIEFAAANLDPEASTIDPLQTNAALLNAALLNASLLNASLLNANLLNAALLNANLLNLSVYDATAPQLDAELIQAAAAAGVTLTVGEVILFAADPANNVNASLLNAALLNANLLNANLLNASLLNANLLNASLLNASLLNASLLNASLLNPSVAAGDLDNANLLNASLLNASLLNPTLVALATEGGCCDHEPEPTIGSILVYALGHPETINASLLNASLLNAALLNANLLNANLLNANLLNASLLNANLLNASLLNASLLNADLLNANLLNASLLNASLLNTAIANGDEVTYDDYTFPITNTGNVTTAVDADVTINAPTVVTSEGDVVKDVLGTKLITWTANATPTVIECVDRVQLDPRVQAIGGIDDTLEIATIDEPFNGEITAIVAPGETMFVTLRVLGTPEQLKNVRISGFTASSQAANCVTVNGAPVCDSQLNQGIEQIVFADTTPPVVTVPADIVVEATSPDGAYVDYTVQVVDASDPQPTLVCMPESGDLFYFGTTPVSCYAQDAAGNMSDSVTFDVTVRDTILPVITAPADITFEANGSPRSIVPNGIGEATATDVFGVTITSDAPADGFLLGPTTVTWTATDGNGNQATATQLVTVVDTTPPSLPVYVDRTVQATSTAGTPVTWNETATDIVDGSVAVNCTPASGAAFAIGTTPVSCSVADTAGNTADASFNVTVEDTTSPVIDPVNPPTGFDPNQPYPFEADFDGNTVFVSWPINVTDADPGLVIACTAGGEALAQTSLTFDGDRVTATFVHYFPVGRTTVTCVATDSVNPPTEITFNVDVVDVAPPGAPSLPPDDFSAVEAISAAGAVVSWAPLYANDAVDGSIEASCTPPSGSTFSLGTTTVSCSATDQAGKQGPASMFAVTVVDTTPPTLSGVPTSIVSVAAGADGTASPDLDAGIGASDSVDPAPMLSCASTAWPLLFGSNIITCTATDASGNSTSLPYTINVIDQTPPTITLNGPASLALEAGVDSYVEQGATATDNVDGDLTQAIVITGSVDAATVGTYTLNYDVADNQGQTAMTVTRTVNVVDTTAPVITVPSSTIVVDTLSVPVDVDYTVTVADAGAPGTTAECDPASGSGFGWGDTTVTCNASDGANSAESVSFTVRVRYAYDIELIIDKTNVKLGSTIPIDWAYLDRNTGQRIDSSAINVAIEWHSTGNCAAPDNGGVSGEDSGSSDFRYSASESLWQYSLQTKDLLQGNYLVTIRPPGVHASNATTCVTLR